MAGVYTISLVVTDEASLSSAPDVVLITASVPNAQPTADAGPDGTGATNVAVQFDGTASSDPDLDSLTFAWTFTSAPAGSVASLVNSTTATPTLTPDLPGTYVMQLVVNDGQVDSDPSVVEFEAIDALFFAENKLREASCYVAGLSLDNFFQGHDSANKTQKYRDKRAEKAKRSMLKLLQHTARDVRKIGDDVRNSNHTSAAHLESRKRHTLEKIDRAIQHTDGVALRSAPDGKGSGFRRDFIIGTTSSVAVFNYLTAAATAVAAIQW